MVRQRLSLSVLEIPDTGKSCALNAGDAHLGTLPGSRVQGSEGYDLIVYLDADVSVSSDTLTSLADTLSSSRRPSRRTGKADGPEPPSAQDCSCRAF